MCKENHYILAPGRKTDRVFLRIRFPERKAHSGPKKRRNTLSAKGKRITGRRRQKVRFQKTKTHFSLKPRRSTLSRNESAFARGVSTYASSASRPGQRAEADKRGPEAGSTLAGPAWPSSSSRSGRNWPRETPAPTELAGASGHGRRRTTH